jgi:hypothetical protein
MPSANALRSPSYLLYAAFLFVAPVPSIAQEPPASEKTFCSKASYHFQAGGDSIPYEIVDGMVVVEEDIIVGRKDDSASFGAVVLQKARTWDGRVVPYKYAAGFPDEMKDWVRGALRDLNEQTNNVFTFIDITDIASNQSYTDFVTFKFTTSRVCNSSIGKMGGEQFINLSGGCQKPQILHEIGHALGLYHEHNRPDRDLNVKINWNNIDLSKEGARTAFCRIRRGEGVKKGAYDFDSIMHYPSRNFAKQGTTTIDAREVGKKVSDKHNQVLSAGDKKTLADLYAPTGTLPPPEQNQNSCDVSSKDAPLVKGPVFAHAYMNSAEVVFALASRGSVQADGYDDRGRKWHKIKVDKFLEITFDKRGALVVDIRPDGHPVLNKTGAVVWVFAGDYNKVVGCP